MWNYKRWKNSYDFNQHDYTLIDDVYNNVKDNSRVIFIVRHAERWRDYSHSWWLTEYWKEQAKELWKRLTWWKFSDTSTDFYWSTSYKRAHQTSYFLWCSRWYSPFLEWEAPNDNNWEEYEKVKHPIESVEFDRFRHVRDTDIQENAIKLIEEVCELTQWHPFSFITSHDYLVIPLIRWITEREIDFTLDTRINYLSWIAIIINENDEWEVYPIRTLKERTMVLLD